MIGVIGTAKVSVYDNKQISNLDINRDDFKIKIITNPKPSLYEIKFFIEIQDKPECKILDDYVGLIRPILEQKTKCFIIFVQILKTIDMGKPTIISQNLIN